MRLIVTPIPLRGDVVKSVDSAKEAIKNLYMVSIPLRGDVVKSESPVFQMEKEDQFPSPYGEMWLKERSKHSYLEGCKVSIPLRGDVVKRY